MFLVGIDEEITVAELGAQRYAAFCDATNKTGTEFVMQAATFFGPDKHYENDWAIPGQKETIPADERECIAWGEKRGIHPRPGESMWDFRKRLEQSLGDMK
jgi:hypothetical protein